MVAIDLGSNTIRMVEYDCTSKTTLNSYEKIVKTADKLVETHKISDEAVERIIEAIIEAKKTITLKDVVAYATEALRQAQNQTEVLETIKEKTGIDFKIASTQDEAYFTTVAVEQFTKENYNYKTMFLVDIGGGSTELIVKNKKELLSESCPVGIVTISQKYNSIETLEYGIKQEIKPFKDFIKFVKMSYSPDIFVASSGTPTTIAALKMGLDYSTYDAQKVNGVELNIDELDFWMNKLLKMELRHREKLVGVGRGNLIVTGIMIFKEIFRLGEFEKCIVIDNGVREGIALDYCK